MLFTPAPALAIASRLSGISISCIFAERTIIAVGFSALSLTVYLALSKISVPQAAILFKVNMLYIKLTSFIYLSDNSYKQAKNKYYSEKNENNFAF